MSLQEQEVQGFSPVHCDMPLDKCLICTTAIAIFMRVGANDPSKNVAIFTVTYLTAPANATNP